AREPDQARPRRVPPARPDLQPLTPAEGARHLDDPAPHPLPVPVAGFPVPPQTVPPQTVVPQTVVPQTVAPDAASGSAGSRPGGRGLSVGGRAGRPRSSTSVRGEGSF